ncbi:MAG: 5' nucleotidase, NT5C type [Elusimicrobiota bacterium]
MFIYDPKHIKTSRSQKKKTIFLDMDGVLCFFIKSVCDLFGVDLEDKKNRNKIKDGEKLKDILRIDDQTFWKKIDNQKYSFWENMEPLPWAKDLYDLAKQYDFAFLTSPGKCPFAASGKCVWIKKNFGDDAIEDLVIARNKWRCANNQTILVDDQSDNIDDFIKQEGGGFLWPQELRIIDEDVKIDDVMDDLKEYIDSF